MESIRAKLSAQPSQSPEPARIADVSDKTILLIEDDPGVQDLVRFSLQRQFPRLHFCDSGQEGFRLALRHHPDLILLDVMLPDLNGLGVYQLLKSHEQTKDIPVLVMTGMSEWSDVVKDAAVMVGADFMRKPFGEFELLHRVDRLIHRPPATLSPILGKGPFKLDGTSRSVWIYGEHLHNLSPKEFDLLAYLVGKSPAIAGWAEILMDVWQHPLDVSSKSCPHETIEVHARTLRTKLGKAGRCIVTHKGVGLQCDCGRCQENPTK